MEILKGEQLNMAMDKCMSLCFPNIHNLITSFKHHPIYRSYINNILLLNSKICYDYIQNNCFLGQIYIKKVFLFKLFVDGYGRNVELVKLMQLDGDLKNTWMMFHHVKHHGEKYTTMVCHIYDPFYYKITTIIVYDMKSKSTSAIVIN